jgi:meso-butanediol dehydrogenase/(S,S)-butanediol dehydrogenase/diacetyl reductase
MLQRFQGKVAICTGGASGIGLATTRLLVAEGCCVVIGDLNAVAQQSIVSELGRDHVFFYPCDVSQADEVDALVSAAVDTFGGVDILVNGAGITSDLCSSVDLSLESWHRVMSVNLDSVFYACKSVVPRMRVRGGGAIVNIASISGLAGDYGFNAYNAAKGAVVNFTRSVALDHASENIRVNVICPGLIDTPLTEFMGQKGVDSDFTDRIPMRRMGRPEEIAKITAFLASEDASYITGSVVVADGGLTAGSGNPNLADVLLRHQSGH